MKIDINVILQIFMYMGKVRDFAILCKEAHTCSVVIRRNIIYKYRLQLAQRITNHLDGLGFDDHVINYMQNNTGLNDTMCFIKEITDYNLPVKKRPHIKQLHAKSLSIISPIYILNTSIDATYRCQLVYRYRIRNNLTIKALIY
uniref:Uncharacterized protein n=1 Tax=Megaviridae environmental sample TaxID=1737588 RepID=A0A5J6VI67_9VIRU|nr:MAG: hypothetical protein [Megaviridae environmental sample]